MRYTGRGNNPIIKTVTALYRSNYDSISNKLADHMNPNRKKKKIPFEEYFKILECRTKIFRKKKKKNTKSHMYCDKCAWKYNLSVARDYIAKSNLLIRRKNLQFS